jgi:hypothetical protein
VCDSGRERLDLGDFLYRVDNKDQFTMECFVDVDFLVQDGARTAASLKEVYKDGARDGMRVVHMIMSDLIVPEFVALLSVSWHAPRKTHILGFRYVL